MNKGALLFFFLFVFVIPVRTQLLINEIQASNINTGVDPGVNYRQWVEFYNGGAQTVDLYGYYLSDHGSELKKYLISEHISVGSKKVALLWLDPDKGDYGNLKLDMDGGVLTLSDPSGELLDYLSYSGQYIDISYGREAGGSSTWSFFKEPSPGGPNISKGYSGIEDGPTLSFSLDGGFYHGPQQISLATSSTTGIIRYTKDGSWPVESSPRYDSPIEISSSGVIRARVFDDEKLPGEVVTHTYFIDETSSLPVVSISSDPKNFFSGDRGIYVEGYRGISGWCSPDPVNWNRDWERPVNFEYYTADGEQVINQLAGTKITGGCSRFNTFKSLALYARKRYGDNSFSYKFFSTKTVSEFKGLVLRNSGNDGYYSMLRDGFMQSLVMGEMDIDYLGYQPANVFINGEYWGILNVREKINEHYLASNYSIDPDRVDLLEKEDYFDYNLVITGTGEHYENLINFVEQNDLSLESNFERVSSMMDVEEFLNYYLVDIYFQNEDWPQNNIKYWRYQGEEGKWRWILYDTDFGWGLFPQSGNSLNWATRGASCDRLIRALLQNEQFKNEFIQRMAGFMNTVFHPVRVKNILDSISNEVGREIPRHTQRWGRPSAIEYDYQTNSKMPRWAETRPDSMRLFMRYKFGISGHQTLSVHVNDPAKGGVQAAGVNLPDQFSGLYFRNVPLRMHAVPKPGYVFSHWEGSSSSSSRTIYLDMNADQSLTAVFEAAAPAENIYLNELGASNASTLPDEYDQLDDWIEIYNDNDYAVDLAGAYLSDSAGFLQMYQLPYGSPALTTIEAKEYLIIWCDNQTEQGALHTNFKLKKEGEPLFLSMKQADSLIIIDSLVFSEQYTDITFGRRPDTDDWDYLLPTPGSANIVKKSLLLRINEFLSSNDGSYRDEHGESDDWIELFNPTGDSIDIAGLFLTDSLQDPLKHQIPSGDIATIIPPKGYLILWADGQEEQGVFHLGFKLNGKSEEIGLYQLGSGYIDSLSYGNIYPGAPMGRFPDGSPLIQYVSASPGSENEIDPLEGLFINEYASRNKSLFLDEYGEADDWIEIYNQNDFPVDLGGLFLTDSLGYPAKFRIPGGKPDSTTIPARGYLLLWADDQEEQGVLHLGFKLDSRSEQIGLYQLEAGMIDSLSYHQKFPSANEIKMLSGIRINEIMPKNSYTLKDEYGEFDDWIEIYNENNFPVDLGGIFITDSLGHPTKYRIPGTVPDSTTIPAQDFLILWADNQKEQGVLHLDFSLSADKEQIGLFQPDGSSHIDTLSFGGIPSDQAIGLPGGGVLEFRYLTATPGKTNFLKASERLIISEIVASGNVSVNVGGLYLTDSMDAPTKYRIPSHTPTSTTIGPRDYFIIFADGQKEQGINHADFKLKREGEQIALIHYDEDEVLDSLTYRKQFKGASFSYLRTEGVWASIPPTPGSENHYPDLSGLHINEMMGNNKTVVSDEFGQYDNWVELYNNSDMPIDIGGLYVSDSLPDLYKFRVSSEYPDSTTIGPYEYLTLWADNTPDQGILHLGFGISKTGEAFGLFDYLGRVVDSISYPFISPNLSWGRIPDGFDAWTRFEKPTPSESNGIAILSAWDGEQKNVMLYPNPMEESAIFEIPSDKPGKIRIEIIDSNGRVVSILESFSTLPGIERIPWDAKDASRSALPPGIYIFHVFSGERNHTGKFVVR